MSLVAEIALAARPRYVVLGRRLFAVRRIDTTALRKVGFAALEGSALAKAADAKRLAERREADAEIAALEGDARAAAIEALAAREAEAARRRSEAILATAEGDAAFRARMDAYVLAATMRIAALRPDVDLPSGLILAADTEPEAVARNLAAEGAPPVYSEPIEFVRTEEEASLPGPKVWLHVLTADERVLLGQAIATLQAESVLSEVSCFPGGSGDVPSAAPDRADVRPAPARDPRVGTVATGAGGEMRGRRTGGRRSAGP